MKIKSRRYFEVKYSIMKPSSQNFDVLTQNQPRIGSRKGTNSTSCTSGDRKVKSGNKRNFEVRYSFMKLFFKIVKF